MTLKNLIKNNKWAAISPLFLDLYSDAEEDIVGYEVVFNNLGSMKPVKIDMFIVIYKEKDSEEEYIDVSGLHKYPKNKEEKYPQGIELTPWSKWLGMTIHPATLEMYSEQEIIVHCLYEMTFAGFSNEDIPKAIQKIENRMKEPKTMTEKERLANTEAVEEMLNGLKNK